MSRLEVFNQHSRFGLLTVLIFCTACSRLMTPSGAGPASDLNLTTQLSQGQYRLGEPVLARVTLGNTRETAVETPQLDHTTVAFTVQPQLKSSLGELRFVEPVYSGKEDAGRMIRLPGAGEGPTSATVPRDFVFTTLSFEPGTYLLEAVYSRPSAGTLKPARKTYSKAVLFTVAPGAVYAHRYVNGLLARQDAINLAAAQAGAAVKSSDTLLVTDEAGFYKWWVNLTLEGTVKSYFVDTTYPRVWKEARPFTAADQGVAGPTAQDAQMMQRLKDQTIQKRVK